MAARQLLVLGGGFAGMWSAVGAVRKLDEMGLGPDEVEIKLVNRDPFHNIRVRNYEADLTDVRLPLDEVLKPIGVRSIVGTVQEVRLPEQQVVVATADGEEVLLYDRLVFALGSQLVHPAVPGLVEHAFDVDTYDGASRLNQHLEALSTRADSPGRFTVIVIGAGLTGIEVACEMPGKLHVALDKSGLSRPTRVILADRNPWIGSDMGEAARPVIVEALTALKIETRPGVDVREVTAAGVTLASGEQIPAATVVWCAGMQASPLTKLFPVARDRFGRLPVDEFMRIKGLDRVFAAGDSAVSMMDQTHASVMSCQHGRPMGRFAGHNVVSDLLGLPLLPLEISWYVTVLDLGPWGALYTEGWDRHLVAVGAVAKRTKQTINCQRIYPPRSGDRAEILAAAAPVVQSPPATYRS